MQQTELFIDPTLLGIGDSGSVRAAGLHASDIYNSFFKDYNPKRYGQFKSDKPDPLLCEPGLIFENMLEEGLRRRLEGSHEDISRPGEFTWTGEFNGKPVTIHYNPDLFIFNGVFRVGEIKATWMSSGLTSEEVEQARNGDSEASAKVRDTILDSKFEKYLAQIQFYCYFLNTPYARLYAFFINANYKPPFPPQLLAWELHFTQDELDYNFGVLMRDAESKGMF